MLVTSSKRGDIVVGVGDPYELVRKTAGQWAAGGRWTPQHFDQARAVLTAALADDPIIQEAAVTFLTAVERTIGGEPVDTAAIPFVEATERAALAGQIDLSELLWGIPFGPPE